MTFFIARADSYREAISDAADFAATDPDSANAPSPGSYGAFFARKSVASASLALRGSPRAGGQIPDRSSCDFYYS